MIQFLKHLFSFDDKQNSSSVASSKNQDGMGTTNLNNHSSSHQRDCRDHDVPDIEYNEPPEPNPNYVAMDDYDSCSAMSDRDYDYD